MLIEDMQIRNLAVNTQESYIQQVSRFAQYFQKSPEVLGPEHIRAYQLYLTNEKKLSTGSIIVTISALRFLYRVTLKKDWSFTDFIPAPKVPKKLPVILSPEEVVQFLSCVRTRKHRAILTTCYAAGLRVSEAVALTPPAIDSKRMVLRVEQGKGQKDRYTMLSPKLLEILRAWWRVERPKDWLFPGDIPGSTSQDTRLNRSARRRAVFARSPNRSHRIPCATLSPFICWNKAPTFGAFSCCSAIVVWPLLQNISA
jgi:integrase/recombinase XerD